MKKIKELFKTMFHNWREVVGWATIIIFIYIYLCKIYDLKYNLGFDDKDFAFNFLVIATIFILGWLKLNNKKQ